MISIEFSLELKVTINLIMTKNYALGAFAGFSFVLPQQNLQVSIKKFEKRVQVKGSMKTILFV